MSISLVALDARVGDFVSLWGNGKRTEAKELAVSFIDNNIGVLKPVLGAYDVPGLVSLVDEYRANGKDKELAVVDMWIAAKVPQQHITSTINKVVE